MCDSAFGSLRASCVAALAFCAWTSHHAIADVHVFEFTLEGAQEVPPNASPGTGSCTVTVDDVLRTLQVDCAYAGLLGASTDAHLRVAPPGTIGPIMATLEHSSATSGTCTVDTILAPSQIQLILDGSTYINIQSSAFPTGEIRGQIVNPPAPQSLYIFGLEHTAIGAATLEARDDDGDGYARTLILDNLGSSGQDGVSVRLGPVNGGVERPGVHGCFFSLQHVIDVVPPDPVASRDVLKSYFETGDIPTQDQLIIDHSYNGVDGEISFVPSPDLAVQTVAITLRHEGEAVYTTTVPFAPVEALVTGPISEVEFTEIDTAILIELLIYPEFDITPIPMEKELRFGSARMLSVLGAPATLADQVEIEVVYASDYPELKFIRMELAAVANGPVHISKEGVIHRDVACRALGDAHIVGSEECSTGVCEDALVIDNLGSSGQDGVSCRVIPDRDSGRSKGFGISFLPVALDNTERLTIGSEWCPASSGPGDDDDCDSPISIWCALEGTATGATIEADFSGAGVTAAKAYARKNGAIVAADFDYPASAIAPVPGGTLQIVSATDADHVTGQYMAGFVWKFAGDGQLEIPGQPSVLIDELLVVSATPIKKEEGGRHTPFHNRWQAGGIGHTIVITAIEPAEVAFTQGHVFGLEHTALNDGYMTVSPGHKSVGEITLRVTSPPDADPANPAGVEIDLGSADAFRIKFDTGLPTTSKTGITCKVLNTASVNDSGWSIGHVQDAQGLLVPEISVFSEATGKGGRAIPIDIAIYHQGQLSGLLENVSQSTKMKLTSGQPEIVDNKKGLLVSFHIAPPDGGAGTVEIDGQTYMADTVNVSGDVSMPATISSVELTLEADSSIEIVGEAIGVGDTFHHATGAARFVCCADLDQDGREDIVIHNPTFGSVSGIYSEKASYGGMTGIGHPNYRATMIVPDPCAGLPPDCISWPNDAALEWHVHVGGQPPLVDGAPPVLRLVNSYQVGEGASPLVRMELDASDFGVDVCHLQMYLKGVLIDDVPDYAGPIEVSGRGGNNENWLFGGSATVGGASLTFTSTFTSGRYVLRAGVPVAGENSGVLCDELRFTISPPAMQLQGILATGTITRDIELVHLTDMEFDPELLGDVDGDGIIDENDRSLLCAALGSLSGEPEYVAAADLDFNGAIDHLDQALFNSVLPPCDGDVVTSATFAPPADGVTDAADLAYLLGEWGDEPSCADYVSSATFAPPPDGHVDAADLAFLLGGWGPCR